MLDTVPGAELPPLDAEFPPASKQEWEAAIHKELKGADYDKKLVWQTDEGLAIRAYYRREDLEPLGQLADLAPGEFPYTRGAGTGWEEAQDWTAPASAIRADYLHEAGATAVQELAFALAEGVEELQSATESGKSVDSAAPALVFVYAVGSNYFFEIAKLRAARALWSAAVQAFGCEDPRAALARIHVRTARSNKTLLDPDTNLLRVTTEALSAVLGGCDSLAIEAFGFDSHLALNLQRILREEAHIGRVCDPAGGSYYIEALTHSLATEAWRLFQQVEALAGWTAAQQSGFVEAALTKSRDAKIRSLASRRRIMAGVNSYPNTLTRTMAPAAPPALAGDPFTQTRLAEPFEAIYARTLQFAAGEGRFPTILLLKRGDLKMKMTRANFCLNLFGCAGFDIVESGDYTGTDADLIVLCSSDSEYPAFAREVCAATALPVLVAGNPRNQISELEALGIQAFVHAHSNAVETLTYWQDKLNMPELRGARP